MIMQGEEQAKISFARYHSLCTVIQGKRILQNDIAPDAYRGRMFTRQGIMFTLYTVDLPDPILGINIHTGTDDAISPGDLQMCNPYF